MGNGSDEKLMLSDWITFLSSEKGLYMSLIPSLGAFVVAVIALVVAAVAVVVAIPNHSRLDFVGPAAVLVIGLCVLKILGEWFAQRGQEARELLNKVMFGELKDVSAIKNDPIYKKWKERETKKKTPRRKKDDQQMPIA